MYILESFLLIPCISRDIGILIVTGFMETIINRTLKVTR